MALLAAAKGASNGFVTIAVGGTPPTSLENPPPQGAAYVYLR